jgi:hypothetical protein
MQPVFFTGQAVLYPETVLAYNLKIRKSHGK